MRALMSRLAACVAISLASIASGTFVQQDLNIEYSGGSPPSGSAPWLRATFDDSGSAGSVLMTLSAVNLTGSEFVSKWYFNLDPSLDPSQLNFATQSVTGSFASPSIFAASNAFLAAGATQFDILVNFVIAPPENRFGGGDSVSFLITGIPTLTAESFNFLSVPGGKGPFISAAHVQGIGSSDESGWIAFVPEPASIGLLLLGGMMLGRRRR